MSHSNEENNLPLIVFAVAIGIDEEELNRYKVKFVKIIKEYINEMNKKKKDT
jgi:hypothetical protein